MATQQAIAPLLVITGQTASGKSDFGFKVAKSLGGEIICADSRTIYKKMDIATAKPNQSKRSLVKHHMLDLVNPDEKFSAAQFQELAKVIIDQIWSKGKLPILVGGTGLYIDSIVFDYRFRKINDTQKNKLEKMDLAELNKLAQTNSLYVADPKNKRYLISLLSGGIPPQDRSSLRENCLIIGLNTPRTKLRENITKRVEHMFKAGLKREVSSLLKVYNWLDPGMTGIGYREFKQYYDNAVSMAATKQKIIYDTLQFAKRQRTWFKRNQYINWFEDTEKATECAERFWSQFKKSSESV